MNNKLKPCPFCGGKASTYQEGTTDEQKSQIQAQMQADFEAEMQRLEPELYQI